MSSLNVNILTPNITNEFDINLLSPLSISSNVIPLVENFHWLAQEQHSIPPVVRSAKDKTKTKAARAGVRKPPLLACLNCRQKKVKVGISPENSYFRCLFLKKCQWENEGCKRCIKFSLQCVVPDGDERKRCGLARIYELTIQM